MSNLFVLSIGFLAQLFFSARILVQWFLSEKAGKVLSPSIFWIFSLMGAYLLCIYGWLRNDFAIILGQFMSYYVYLWNLKGQGIWKNIAPILKWVLVLTPFIAVCFVLCHAKTFIQDFFQNDTIPLTIIILGSIGQILFTLRFVYQLCYSYKKGMSVLPGGFWLISLFGSLLIIIYGIMRLDIVLIIGQTFGSIAYMRNLWIGHNNMVMNDEKL